MDYKTVISIHRKGNLICFYLKEGEELRSDNIVDVVVYENHAPDGTTLKETPNET